MTAPDPRVGEIEDRLAAVKSGPWELFSFKASDIAYLLAELRDREGKLARVEGLADEWARELENPEHLIFLEDALSAIRAALKGES